MTVGPLRRLIGAVGLVFLVPVAVSIVLGRIDPVAAATRAAAVLLLVAIVGRVVGAAIRWLAESVEGSEDATSDEPASREAAAQSRDAGSTTA